MRANRFVLFLVATMFILGLSLSAVYAQDNEDGITCDVDLMLDLYIAERYFGFSSFVNQMSADDLGFNLDDFNRGQFTPLFDDMATTQNNVQMSAELRNHLMETMAMTNDEFETHFNDEMMPEIGEMMGEDFSTLTELPTAEGMSDEASECAELRQMLRRFFIGLVFGEVEFGDAITGQTGTQQGQTQTGQTGTQQGQTGQTDTQQGNNVAAGAMTVNLTGEAEVPAPGDEDGTGTAVVYLRTDTNEVCVDISVQAIALPATAAHIHQAPPGEAGPPVVPLNAPGANGVSSTCVTVDAALMQEMLNNTRNFYVNVHNEEFPEGAVRGQLGSGARGASQTTTTTTDTTTDTAGTTDTDTVPGAITVNLAGQEGISDADATGTALVYLRPDTNEVCVDVNVQNIAAPATVGVYQGAQGEAGQQVFNLNAPNETGLSSTCQTVDPALMQEMMNNPGNFSVQLFNDEFPQGAARGQLGGQ